MVQWVQRGSGDGSCSTLRLGRLLSELRWDVRLLGVALLFGAGSARGGTPIVEQETSPQIGDSRGVFGTSEK